MHSGPMGRNFKIWSDKPTPNQPTNQPTHRPTYRGRCSALPKNLWSWYTKHIATKSNLFLHFCVILLLILCISTLDNPNVAFTGIFGVMILTLFKNNADSASKKILHFISTRYSHPKKQVGIIQYSRHRLRQLLGNTWSSISFWFGILCLFVKLVIFQLSLKIVITNHMKQIYMTD